MEIRFLTSIARVTFIVAVTAIATVSTVATPADADPNCESTVLALSALNRAAHITELMTTIQLLPKHGEERVSRYLTASLKNEVEVAKSLLASMEMRSDKAAPTNLGFINTRTGALLQKLIDNKNSLSVKLEDTLPHDLRDRFGNEGVALFDALFRATEYLREQENK